MSVASPSSSSTAAIVEIEAAPSPPNFDPSLSDDEKHFYTKAYPSVELVRERKVHCTTCKCHIGTAPSQENSIKMHPVLRVTHCNKCHDFYNSGEFSKGEDGSELYCRWCGQGGEVYCCSNCPFVFCKSCIVKNLSRGVVADIEQNENWSCFNCAPKILWPLRAQHWALIKYIEKQKKVIAALDLPEAEAKLEMQKDRSTCCRLAKAKCGNMSDSMESIDSLSRRSLSGASTGSASKKTHKLASRSQSPAAKRPKSNNDEVVCTPDLLSMLEPDCQITVSAKPRPTQSPMASSPKVMSIQNPNTYGGVGGSSSIQCSTPKNTPPPLVLRNTSVQMRPMPPSPIVRRTVVGPRSATAGGAAPVYHTINGYRIDLNSAAQQETFRLPNGKLIQVKRQGSGVSPTTNPVQSTQHQQQQHQQQHQQQQHQQQQQQQQQQHNAWQRSVLMQQQSRPVQIAPAHPASSQQYPQITIQQHAPQQHAPQQHPQMLRYQNTMVGNTTVTALHNGSSAQIHVINGAPGAPPQQQQQQPAPQQQQTVPPQASARPLMVRHVFPDSAIGQARTQLQDQVFNAMEICQHLTGKVQTLTNSNAYKQARNYLEVKELYIHLSYLLTYAIGRFKGLQDKCLGDMRQLGFVNDADSLENGQLAADKQASDDEDNEIEIVEPKTDTINLDSDNEDDVPQAAVSNPSPNKSALQIALTQPKATPQLVQPSAPAAIPAILSEDDIMSSAQSFLASMLEVDLFEGDQNSLQTSPNGGIGGGANGGDATQKKQPRKKTTNKPNPTLLKQKQILERERLEEMKRNDMKLKMKCTIELKKAEEEFPFAKDMLGAEEVAADANKKDDDNEEVEVLFVEDVDSSLEEEKDKDKEKDKEKEKPKALEEKLSENQGKGECPLPGSEKSKNEEKFKTKAEVKEMNEDNNSGTEKKTTEPAAVVKVIVKSSSIEREEDEKTENETTKINDENEQIKTVSTTSKAEQEDKNERDKGIEEGNVENTAVNQDVEMPESVKEDDTKNIEAEDLNTSETKDIEMIEVAEEEEEDEKEKVEEKVEEVPAIITAIKVDAAAEPQPEVKDDEKITNSEDNKLSVENVDESTESVKIAAVESLINGDDELNEQIEKILQTRKSEASKDEEFDEDSSKIEPEKEPELEPNKEEVSANDDLMDDINELIENAMT